MAARNPGWQSYLSLHPDADRADSPEFWDEFLAEHPEVLHHLLSDLFRATYGAERPPSLDDLWAILDAPEFSTKPFGPTVKELLARRGHSSRWLAMQAGLPPQHLGRFINEQRPIINIHDTKGSMQRIESIAVPLRVHPSYFSEWRRMWVMQLLDSAFTTRPELSMDLFRRFAGFERNARSREGQPA